MKHPEVLSTYQVLGKHKIRS